MRVPFSKTIIPLLLLVAGSSGLRATQGVLLADAVTQSTAPSTNFGSGQTLRVDPVRSTLVKFSVRDSLPASFNVGDIAIATLLLYVSRVDTPGSVALAPVCGSWTEPGLTFQNQPAACGEAPVVFTVNAASAWVAVDITSLVRRWANVDLVNQGLILVTVDGAAFSFDSKENTSTSHAPQLQITLQGQPGPQGPPGSTGQAGSQGSPGLAGTIGPTGTKGADGLAGPIGATGPAGTQGPIGLDGIPGQDGLPGMQGNTGPQGPPGPGLTGIQSLSDAYRVKGLTTLQSYKSCGTGQRLLSGGCTSQTGATDTYLKRSYPSQTNEWSCKWQNESVYSRSVQIWVRCATEAR